MVLATHHGGYCCGMTHIRGFPYDPQSRVDIQAKGAEEWAACKGFEKTLPIKAPAETAEKRFRRVLAGAEGFRAKGIIEVVLNHRQKPYWNDMLIGLGFKEVNHETNSNTTNTIHVFHRNSGSVGLPQIKIDDLEPYKEVVKEKAAPLR